MELPTTEAFWQSVLSELNLNVCVRQALRIPYCGYRAGAAIFSVAMKQQRELGATKRYVWEGIACCDDQRVYCLADSDRRRFRRMFDRSVKEISSVEKYAHMCSFPGPCTLFEALWNRFKAISD